MFRHNRPHGARGRFDLPWEMPADRPHTFHFGPPPGRPDGPPWGGPFGPGGPFGDDPFGHGPGRRQRQRRGDIKFVLLALVAEQPRHGYELIKELEQRYGGFYRPSPGSVYPTLQLLEDEGHLTSEAVDGKRVYTITTAGRQLLAERGPAAGPERGGPWGGAPTGSTARTDLHELRERSMALMGVLQQVARHGTPDQVRAASEQIEAARRELYRILAEEKGAE